MLRQALGLREICVVPPADLSVRILVKYRLAILTWENQLSRILAALNGALVLLIDSETTLRGMRVGTAHHGDHRGNDCRPRSDARHYDGMFLRGRAFFLFLTHRAAAVGGCLWCTKLLSITIIIVLSKISRSRVAPILYKPLR